MKIEERARLNGMTRRLIADCGQHCLELFVSPHADLDGTFPAVDADDGVMLTVNGWLWSFEDYDVAERVYADMMNCQISATVRDGYPGLEC